MEDRLRYLKALHDDGLVTDDEYAKKLQLVVDQLGGTQPPQPIPPPAKSEPMATPNADMHKPCATPGCYERRTTGSFCPKHSQSRTIIGSPSSEKSTGGRKALFITVVALIVISLIWAFGGGESTPSSSPSAGSPSAGSPSASSSSGRDGDASSRLACSHFRNVAGDASAGILTDSELRQKLKEVNDTAKVSDVSSVRRAAQSMLSASTSGSLDSLSSAVSSMDSACKSVGY